MNKIKFLLVLIFSIIFTGCELFMLFVNFEEGKVDMSSIYCEFDKKIYNVDEEINVQMYGNFLIEDCVIGGVCTVSVDKIFEDKKVSNSFEIIKINDADICIDNDDYEYFMDTNKEMYRYEINPFDLEKYVTKFDRNLVIKIKESGEYILTFGIEVTSYNRISGSGVEFIKLPFTVTE